MTAATPTVCGNCCPPFPPSYTFHPGLAPRYPFGPDGKERESPLWLGPSATGIIAIRPLPPGPGWPPWTRHRIMTQRRRASRARRGDASHDMTGFRRDRGQARSWRPRSCLDRPATAFDGDERLDACPCGHQVVKNARSPSPILRRIRSRGSKPRLHFIIFISFEVGEFTVKRSRESVRLWCLRGRRGAARHREQEH